MKGRACYLSLVVYSIIATLLGCGTEALSRESVLHPIADSMPALPSDVPVNYTIKIVDNKILQAWRERLDELKPVWRIGMLEGPNDSIIGRISDAATLNANSIALLDDRQGRITVIRLRSLSFVHVGRPGQGPSEFARPRSVSGDSTRLVVLDQTNRLQTFRPDSGGLSFSFVGSSKLDLMPADFCQMNDRRIVLGSASTQRYLIHTLDHSDNIITSFAEGYRSSDELIRFVMNEGRIACSRKHDLVLIGFARLPEVKAFSASGQLRWVARVQPYKPMALVQESDGTVINGIVPGVNVEGFYLLNFLVNDVIIIAQYARRTLDSYANKRPFDDVHTFVIDIHSGRNIYVGDGVPPIIAIAGDNVLGYVSDPFPQVIGYRGRQ